MSPHRKSLRINQELVVIAVFLALAVVFTLPLLGNLYSSGSGDWDYFMFLYEVPSITLFEYQQFPLWNPYSGGGLSIIGNPQAGHLSPIFLLTALFGVPAGLKIAVTVHTFLGLLGMWVLAGHIGIHGPARFAPPLIFMFSSAWALHIAMGHIVWLPAALLPWLFLTFQKGQGNKGWLIGAAAIVSTMFYEGGTYVLGYALLFLAIYVTVEGLDRKSIQPIISFITVSLLAAGLSAPKLLPVLELLHAHPRPTEVGIGMPLEIFIFFFFDRFASIERSPVTGWWAFGTYLGIVAFSLYLFSLALYRSNKALVVSSLFLLVVSLGNFGPMSPWSLLHQLPVFNGFKVPTRVLIVFCFTAAILIGRALHHLASDRSRRKDLLVGATLVVIFCDLATVSFPILQDVNRPISTAYWDNFRAEHRLGVPHLYDVAPEQSTGLFSKALTFQQPFRQIRIPFEERNRHGAWSDQYRPLLQNTGVVDAYETIPFDRNALAATDQAYRGEFYLMNEGSVLLQEWSPNKLRYKVETESDNLLVINQNFTKDWHSTDGATKSYKGLLAVSLSPGIHDLKVCYSPKSFHIGIFFFIFTLAWILLSFLLKLFKMNT